MPKVHTGKLKGSSDHVAKPGRGNAKGGHSNLRDNATRKRLKMYKEKLKYNEKGTRVIDGAFASSTVPSGMARVQPDRRWFGNTRVIGQEEMDKFREDLNTAVHDPYTVLLREKKIPMGLLREPAKQAKVNLLQVEKFEDTFGKRATRKRPKLGASDYEGLLSAAQASTEQYSSDKDTAQRTDGRSDFVVEATDPLFEKGQSKRIWGELYKVVDSSDVLVQVLDARDPIGTRSPAIENYIRKEKQHKHMILLLNKCDLIPAWCTARWVKVLSREYPTLAFHASVTNSFGKGALIQLLLQFSRLHKDRKHITVGFIGYPNVGKSSIINTVRAKKVCNVAPIPGETKVWQYITLTKHVYLLDCPGVVHYHKALKGAGEEADTDAVLKGVVRVEKLENATIHVPEMLTRVKPEYIRRTYGVSSWTDHDDLLGKIATKRGKLLRGGDPDVNTVAKQLLNDWQRGKVPYFTIPDEYADKQAEDIKAGKMPAVDEEMAELGRKVSQELGKIHVIPDYTAEDRKGEGLSKVEVDMAMLKAMEDGPEKPDEDSADAMDNDDDGDDISGDIKDDGAGNADDEGAVAARKKKKVTKGVKKKKVVKRKAADIAAAATAAGDGDDDAAVLRPKKVKRKTTSKVKTGSTFYADTDVKGKRRKRGGNSTSLAK